MQRPSGPSQTRIVGVRTEGKHIAVETFYGRKISRTAALTIFLPHNFSTVTFVTQRRKALQVSDMVLQVKLLTHASVVFPFLFPFHNLSAIHSFTSASPYDVSFPQVRCSPQQPESIRSKERIRCRMVRQACAGHADCPDVRHVLFSAAGF